MTCSQCIFWKQSQAPQPPAFGSIPQPSPPLGFGNCRRNSPMVIPMPTIGMPTVPPTVWPVTSPDDSCGDFKEKTA